MLHAAERRSEDSQTGSEDSLVQLRRNVVIYVKNVICIAYFVIFINCVSVIHSIVVMYLFNNKQIKKKVKKYLEVLQVGYTVKSPNFVKGP